MATEKAIECDKNQEHSSLTLFDIMEKAFFSTDEYKSTLDNLWDVCRKYKDVLSKIDSEGNFHG